MNVESGLTARQLFKLGIVIGFLIIQTHLRPIRFVNPCYEAVV